MHSSGISPADQLNAEQAATRQLIGLLDQEQALLVQADIDGMTELTEEKAKVVTQLAEHAKLRHQALAASGFASAEAGMQEWLNTPTTPAAARESWNDLLALTRKAKELNRTNGLLISKHMARNQASLNILRGSTAGGNFYGPDGQSSTGLSGKRNLVIG